MKTGSAASRLAPRKSWACASRLRVRRAKWGFGSKSQHTECSSSTAMNSRGPLARTISATNPLNLPWDSKSHPSIIIRSRRMRIIIVKSWSTFFPYFLWTKLCRMNFQLRRIFFSNFYFSKRIFTIFFCILSRFWMLVIRMSKNYLEIYRIYLNGCMQRRIVYNFFLHVDVASIDITYLGHLPINSRCEKIFSPWFEHRSPS